MAHFSFTRSVYDNCALDQKNTQSTQSFRWTTDNQVNESNDSCHLGLSPFQHAPFRNIPSSVIDVESELRGQTRIASQCIQDQYPLVNTVPSFENKINDCTNNALFPDYTRTNRACNVLSGITINRFNPLCEDPQDINRIHPINYIGANTRLQVKDAATFIKPTSTSVQHDTTTYCDVNGMPCAYVSKL
jgi:hypothetical protein